MAGLPSPDRVGSPPSLPSVFVIGDSISLHYGPYLERFLAGSLAYRRKAAEAVVEGAATSNHVSADGPARGRAAQSASLDYPHGPFGENAGDSGMVFAYLRSRPQALATADVVLLNCGLHDLKVDKQSGRHQVPLGTYRHNLAEIVELLSDSPARLVWCTTTPVHDPTHAEAGASLAFGRVQADVVRYNAAATDLMLAAGVPVVDLHALTLALGDVGGSEVEAGGLGSTRGTADLADLYVDHVHFAPWVRAAQGAFLAGWLMARFGVDEA